MHILAWKFFNAHYYKLSFIHSFIFGRPNRFQVAPRDRQFTQHAVSSCTFPPHIKTSATLLFSIGIGFGTVPAELNFVPGKKKTYYFGYDVPVLSW